MKGKKYIIFIVIIVAILALLLVRGFWKQGSGEAQRGNSAVVQLGEDVSSKTAAESVQDVLEQIDESSQETSEEEATSEAEEASSEEVEYDTETLTVSTDKPSKAPEKSSVSVNVTKPTTTPTPESSQQPTTTPTPESSQQPTTTPEPDSGQDTTTPSEPDSTPEESEPSEEPKLELVQEGEYDLRVIPDKYNTGCSNEENMLKINSAVTVGGVEYSLGDNGNTVVIDLYYGNQDILDEVVIKNVDFSGKKFTIRHLPESTKKFTFENCKFDEFAAPIGTDLVECYFYNCSFIRFYGGNSSFYKCAFGGSVSDGMNPFHDIHVYDSYFSDFDHDNPSDVHTDAIQIYGREGVNADNISFQNCRIEIPYIKGGKNTTINACFMLQLEYSSGKNLLFENCIINGGGYSVYSRSVESGLTLKDVIFRNVLVGSGKLYGDIYPDKEESGVYDFKTTDSLYVASVWKDAADKVHLSVTNDTKQDRYLVVETQNGRQEFLIPSKQTVEESKNASFSDLPIDVEVVLNDADTAWVICYDKLDEDENQIRFVNWGDEPVYR